MQLFVSSKEEKGGDGRGREEGGDQGKGKKKGKLGNGWETSFKCCFWACWVEEAALASLVVLDSGYLATHTPFPGVQCRYTCMHTNVYGVHMSVGPPFAQM